MGVESNRVRLGETLTLRLTPRLADSLRDAAAQRDEKVSTLARDLIRRGLRDLEKAA